MSQISQSPALATYEGGDQELVASSEKAGLVEARHRPGSLRADYSTLGGRGQVSRRDFRPVPKCNTAHTTGYRPLWRDPDRAVRRGAVCGAVAYGLPAPRTRGAGSAA